MTVYYTSNEMRCPIPGMLEAAGIPAERRELKVGDYFCGSILADGSHTGVPIERKDIADYFASMSDGRRAEQLYNMSFNFSLSYLVLIGSPRSIAGSDRSSISA